MTFYVNGKDGKMKHWTRVQKCVKVSYNDIFKFEQEVVNQGKSQTKNGFKMLLSKYFANQLIYNTIDFNGCACKDVNVCTLPLLSCMSFYRELSVPTYVPTLIQASDTSGFLSYFNSS